MWLGFQKPRRISWDHGHVNHLFIKKLNLSLWLNAANIVKSWLGFWKPRRNPAPIFRVQMWLIFLSFYIFSILFPSRMLDNDLSSVMRAAEPFDWKRINFVLEAGSRNVKL